MYTNLADRMYLYTFVKISNGDFFTGGDKDFGSFYR